MLCTNAPSIGFNNPNIAKTVAIKFKVNANPIPALMVLKVFLDTLNKWGKSWILSWIKVIFEASIEMSLPMLPIEIHTLACLRDGASFNPSPIIATLLFFNCNSLM